jgi:hypothetical protein
VLEGSKKSKPAAEGPGTSQIYLLTEGECGELEWRQARKAAEKNIMRKQKMAKRTQS